MNSRTMLAQLAIGVLVAFGQVRGAPVITDFSPTVGAPGDQIQLSGSGFSSGNFTVRFWNGPGGVVATVFINSDTLVTATVPNGISTGPISIQQGAGTLSYTANDFQVIDKGPYISSFSPSFGSVNDAVVIYGVHLTNTTAVLFNGTYATEFMPNTAGTQITTRVPSGATNGVITVTTIYGTNSSPGSFTVIGPGPFITDFSPVSGDVGTKVLIDGVHFTGVTNVTFNGQPGIIVAANSDTLIQAQAPVGLTTGPIGVSTVLGSFVTTSNFFGKPVIRSFSPAYARAGTNVLITGTNFLGTTTVSFGGVGSTSVSVINNSNLSVTVPAGAVTGLIRVIVPGGSAFSGTNLLIQPTIYGFSPSFGSSGTSVTITGANLNGAGPVVRFNGVAAAKPTGIAFGQLIVQVPAGASTGSISVSTADGSDTTSSSFFLPASITSFTPTNSGPGSRVSITGQNFLGATNVSFNGIPAAGFNVTNNGSIGATAPATVITGPISVSTPAGLASSSSLFYGAPVITGFTPTHGLPGTNVTINGLNFLGGQVLFNGLAAATVSLNNTQVVARVPTGAQSGPITVLAPAGTNSTSSKFILDYSSNLQVWFTNTAGTVTLGSNLVYGISIVNAGPYAAPNATFTNTLPANAILRAVSIPSPWVLSTNGNLLTGTIGSFGSGNAATLLITVAPQVAGSITDTISVTSDNPDPVPGDNTASLTSTVQPLALLSIGLVADQVMVSWPAGLSNYVLQFQDGLTIPAQWLTETGVPSISGSTVFITETNTGSSRFYRLKK